MCMHCPLLQAGHCPVSITEPQSTFQSKQTPGRSPGGAFTSQGIPAREEMARITCTFPPPSTNNASRSEEPVMSAGKCWQSSQKPPEQIKMRGRDSSRQAGEESAAQLQHRQSKRAKKQKTSLLPRAPLPQPLHTTTAASPAPPPSPLTPQESCPPFSEPYFAQTPC